MMPVVPGKPLTIESMQRAMNNVMAKYSGDSPRCLDTLFLTKKDWDSWNVLAALHEGAPVSPDVQVLQESGQVGEP